MSDSLSPSLDAVRPPRYYIAVDIETTGTEPERHGICQIGAVAATEAGEIVSLFVTDVNPDRHCIIDQYALGVNGFTYTRLWAAPSEKTALANFLEWKNQFSGQTPVAIFHNAPFDVAFLQLAFRRNALDPGRFLRRVRDTATMSPDAFGEEDYPRSLSEICGRLGITQIGQHDALHDALNTCKAFFKLKEILDRKRGSPPVPIYLPNPQPPYYPCAPTPILQPPILQPTMLGGAYLAS